MTTTLTTTPAVAVQFSLTVNAVRREAAVPPHLLLADFLRDQLGLTGTKIGCETGQCGACLVLLDGKSVKSCAVLAVQADGRTVTTIEGIASGDTLTPIQQALWERHGIQCGFCTPAFVIALTDLLNRNPTPSAPEVRSWMDGIFCRCGVFQNVLEAVQDLALAKR
jgi:carbon-monoxide dehydrogenase small subunit